MKTKKRRNPIEVALERQTKTEVKFFKEFLPTWIREVGKALSIARQERWRL